MSGPIRKTSRGILAATALLITATTSTSVHGADARATADSSSAAPQSLRTEWTLDRDALERVGIRRPSRLAYDADGNLHVLDAETRRVVKLDPRGRVLYEVGGYGSDETSLELPVDLVVDRDQSVLILDRGRGAIVAFDRAGRFLGQRPFQGAAAEESRGAGARILLDGFGKLWLLSQRSRDLVPLDDRLGPARATRYLVPEDAVETPTAVTSGAGGQLWLYDARGVLLRFAASGRLAGSVTLGAGGERVSITDLAVDRGGFLFAADLAGQRVLVYDAEGTLVLTRALGGDRISWRPAALALGPRGQVALADPGRDEIQVLMPDRGARP